MLQAKFPLVRQAVAPGGVSRNFTLTSLEGWKILQPNLRGATVSGLFINYRREDTAPYAGRLYDHLCRAFPASKVFMDIDGIDPGEDFVYAINQTLSASKVVIAVIGPKWEKVTDGTGSRRRLDDPDDYVVRELCAALESNLRVIPVLVGGAAMPRSDALPTRLQPLARRNAIEISDTRFGADAERLSSAIARVIDVTALNAESSQRTRNSDTKGDSSLADAVTTFKTLLWTGYALSVLSGFVHLGRAKTEEVMPMLIFYTLLFGFGAWFNVMLLRGKNWARMAFIALLFLAVPAVLLEWSVQSVAEVALNMVSLILSIWLVVLMFIEPIKGLFVRRG